MHSGLCRQRSEDPPGWGSDMTWMGLERCLLLGMRGTSSYSFGPSSRSWGSGDKASGQGGGHWGQVGGLMEWSKMEWGTAVTRGAGAWPGGHPGSSPELQERARAVQTRRLGAAGACGCFKKTENSDASKQSGFSNVDSYLKSFS